jgi:hypothetical protein
VILTERSEVGSGSRRQPAVFIARFARTLEHESGTTSPCGVAPAHLAAVSIEAQAHAYSHRVVTKAKWTYRMDVFAI